MSVSALRTMGLVALGLGAAAAHPAGFPPGWNNVVRHPAPAHAVLVLLYRRRNLGNPPPPSRLAVLNVLRARCFVAGHDAPDGMAILERVGQPRLAR